MSEPGNSRRERLLLTRDGTAKLDSYLRSQLLGQVFTCGDVAVRVLGWDKNATRVEVKPIIVDNDVRSGNMIPLLTPVWEGKECMELDIGSFGQFTLRRQCYEIYTQLVVWNGTYTEWTSYNRNLEWVTVCRYA